MAYLKQIISASTTVLRSRLYLFAFLLISAVVAFLLFLIPLKVIPGNSIKFQLQLFGATDYAMLLFVAGLESLLLVMFFYLFRRARAFRRAERGGQFRSK